MIEASQLTTGVTPLALGVQKADEIGIVNNCVLLRGVPEEAVRFAAEVGGTKLTSVVFSRFLASRNISWRIPPAAMFGG
jgi:hypothetical protein